MRLLAIDQDVESMDDVLNELDHIGDPLRRLRDILTSEEEWQDHREKLSRKACDLGLMLAAVIRHLEQLTEQGHQCEIARREEVKQPVASLR